MKKQKGWSKWTEERIAKLRESYSNESKEQVKNKFPELSWEAIEQVCHRFGIKRPIDKFSQRKGDLSPLLENTNEIFYWIGFITADGHLGNNGFKIILSIKDKEHLVKLSKILKTTVKESKYTAKKSSRFRSQLQYFVHINVYHKKIVPKILEKFDLNNKKTYNPPSIEIFKSWSDELFLSWLIGFIDGDGHIRNDQISIENHASWIYVHNYIIEFLNKKYNQKMKLSKINPRGYSRIFVTMEASKQLRQHIQKYSLPVLERKWKYTNE